MIYMNEKKYSKTEEVRESVLIASDFFTRGLYEGISDAELNVVREEAIKLLHNVKSELREIGINTGRWVEKLGVLESIYWEIELPHIVNWYNVPRDYLDYLYNRLSDRAEMPAKDLTGREIKNAEKELRFDDTVMRGYLSTFRVEGKMSRSDAFISEAYRIYKFSKEDYMDIAAKINAQIQVLNSTSEDLNLGSRESIENLSAGRDRLRNIFRRSIDGLYTITKEERDKVRRRVEELSGAAEGLGSIFDMAGQRPRLDADDKIVSMRKRILAIARTKTDFAHLATKLNKKSKEKGALEVMDVEAVTLYTSIRDRLGVLLEFDDKLNEYRANHAAGPDAHLEIDYTGAIEADRLYSDFLAALAAARAAMYEQIALQISELAKKESYFDGKIKGLEADRTKLGLRGR